MMIRIVRPRNLGLAVCLGFLACCGMESPKPPVHPEGSPAADSTRALRETEPAAIRPSGRRLALLIGINDYKAPFPVGPRSIRNLEGAVNDVKAMREMLIALYGFAPQDILVLTDQAAKREAILRAIQEHLETPTGEGDVVFFYFSGHGSQAANPGSDEPDRMDETIVPADALQGVPDIRDKELRLLFNRILDRRVFLTIALDSCHSGSGVRGLFDGTRIRSVKPDLHDLRDNSAAGPRPEDRGALVFSASQDYDQAYESEDGQGQQHGAFSLALVRAMRDSLAGEPAEETFLRARARLQAEKRFQEPVLAGLPRMRRAPLLGRRAGQQNGRTVVAVESVQSDGTVILQGGLANGLTEGSELRLLGTGPEVRIKVTRVDGFSRSEGRIQGSAHRTLKTGDLVEVVQWTAPAGGPLRVWIPTAEDTEAALALAKELAREAPKKGIRWIEDPTQKAPTHVLRWNSHGWEIVAAQGVEPLGSAIDASTILSKIVGKKPLALFVQLPAPDALVRAIRVGRSTNHSGVEATDGPEQADYVLAGRLAAGGVEYAWLRPGVAETDQRRTSLPVRTKWYPLSSRDKTGRALEEDILRLRKIHAWLRLETPSGADSVYKLAVRRGKSGGGLVGDGDDTLAGQEWYSLVLRAKAESLPAHVEPRYFYIFLIDSDGKSILLFPDPKTPDQNRFPVSPGAPAEIPLGREGVFRVDPPYGADTYFLLTSDERIPNPWVFDSEGVRARGPLGTTPLEELLSITGGWIRSATRSPTPAIWSVERKLFRSVPPATTKKGVE